MDDRVNEYQDSTRTESPWDLRRIVSELRNLRSEWRQNMLSGDAVAEFGKSFRARQAAEIVLTGTCREWAIIEPRPSALDKLNPYTRRVAAEQRRYGGRPNPG